MRIFTSDFRPQAESVKDGTYMPPREGRVAAVITVYNEEASTIKKTMWSLNQQFQGESAATLDVMLVCDGIERMSDSVTKLLIQMFPEVCLDANLWPADAETQLVSVCPKSWGKGQQDIKKPTELENEYMGNLGVATLVIKRNNRKKPNSHEWHFCAFALGGPTYCFTTDCGTFFSPTCLKTMVAYMDDNPGCVGSTARMRNQTAIQQLDADSLDPLRLEQEESLSQAGLRMLQQSWSEYMHIQNYNFADSLGILTVLHGPCCLLRCSAITGEAVSTYFGMLYSPPHEGGLMQASLNLAEDRIYSIVATFVRSGINQPEEEEKEGSCGSIVDKPSLDVEALAVPSQVAGRTPTIKQAQLRFTHLCLDETFYFDNETSLKVLMLQRRRWFNGDFAGMLFYLRNLRNIVFASDNTLSMKLSALIVSAFFLTMSLFMFFTPLIYGLIYFEAVDGLTSRFAEPRARTVVNLTFMGVYTAMYIAFVGVHFKRNSSSDVKFCASVWLPLWALTTTLWTLGIFNLLFLDTGIIDSEWGSELNWRFPLVVLLLTAPLLCSALRSLREFRIVGSPLYFFYYLTAGNTLFSQMVPSYALARMADLTWGNRPEGSLEIADSETKDRLQWQSRVQIKMAFVNMAVVASTMLPLWVFVAYGTLNATATAARREQSVIYFVLTASAVPQFIMLVLTFFRVILQRISTMLNTCAAKPRRKPDLSRHSMAPSLKTDDSGAKVPQQDFTPQST